VHFLTKKKYSELHKEVCFGLCQILLINRKSRVEREGARANPKSWKVCLLCIHICKASTAVTVMVRIIGTPGKYDQRWIIIYPFDLSFRKLCKKMKPFIEVKAKEFFSKTHWP